MTEGVPRLGEDFNLAPLQIAGWVGWLICLPKATRSGTLWQSYGWRVKVDDAIAEAHIQLARRATT